MPRARKPDVLGVGTGRRSPEKDIPSGRAYGARQATERAIQAVPLATPTFSPVAAVPPAGPPPVDAQAALAAAQGYNPAGPGLLDPTQRPNEPVTAGLSSGPGTGPEALNMPSQAGATADALRAIYQTVPSAQNNDFLRLVELAEQQAWQ